MPADACECAGERFVDGFVRPSPEPGLGTERITADEDHPGHDVGPFRVGEYELACVLRDIPSVVSRKLELLFERQLRAFEVLVTPGQQFQPLRIRTLRHRREGQQCPQDPADQALATSGSCAVRCTRAAFTNPANSGCPSRGVEVNSGWNCVATNHGCPGSSMISTRSSFETPEKRKPACV